MDIDKESSQILYLDNSELEYDLNPDSVSDYNLISNLTSNILTQEIDEILESLEINYFSPLDWKIHFGENIQIPVNTLPENIEDI